MRGHLGSLQKIWPKERVTIPSASPLRVKRFSVVRENPLETVIFHVWECISGDAVLKLCRVLRGPFNGLCYPRGTHRTQFLLSWSYFLVSKTSLRCILTATITAITRKITHESTRLPKRKRRILGLTKSNAVPSMAVALKNNKNALLRFGIYTETKRF